MIAKHAQGQNVEWVNLKYAVMCPSTGCGKISFKQGDENTINCQGCKKTFCYICNKHIDGPDHFKGERTCREFSDPFTDF